jgi:hypothetical protein
MLRNCTGPLMTLIGVLSVGTLMSCSSGNGSEAVGATSSADSLGRADDDESDSSDFIKDRAAQGLAIAPVPLNLTGKSDRDIRRIGYGSYLVNAVTDCSHCHSGSLGDGFGTGGYLAGGRRQATVFARNLTPDPTTGLNLTEDQFIQVLRTGVDFDNPGEQLLVMDWPIFRWMSLGDIKAIYAYLQVIPAVTNVVPKDLKTSTPPPVPFPSDYADGDVTRPLPRDTDALVPNYRRGLAIQPFASARDLDDERHSFARGSYLVNAVAECTDCHSNPRADPTTLKINTSILLAGGQKFSSVPQERPINHDSYVLSADLIGETNGYFHKPFVTFDVFKELLTTGTHVDQVIDGVANRPLAERMPAYAFRNMVDDDLRAIYTYMITVAPRTGTGDKLIPPYARWCASGADCNAGETCQLDAATALTECIGGSCAVDSDCDQCQTCNAGACTFPTTTSACIKGGL